MSAWDIEKDDESGKWFLLHDDTLWGVAEDHEAAAAATIQEHRRVKEAAK